MTAALALWVALAGTWIEYPSTDGFRVRAYLAGDAAKGPRKLFVYTGGGGRGANIRGQIEKIEAAGRLEPFLRAGYVILFPAYRGAGGFGPEYEAAFDYGGREVDDVAEGARYLIARGIAGPRHVCFSGVSHGAKISVLVAERYRLATAIAPIAGDYDTSSAAAGLPVPGYTAVLQTARRAPVIRDSIRKQFPNLPDSELLAEARRRDPLLHVDRIACPVFLTIGERDYVVGHYASARLKQELIRHGKPFFDKLYTGPETTHNLPGLETPAAAQLWNDIFDFCEGRRPAGSGSIPLRALEPGYPQPAP